MLECLEAVGGKDMPRADLCVLPWEVVVYKAAWAEWLSLASKLNIPIGLWSVEHHSRKRPRYYRVVDTLDCQVRFYELVLVISWKQQNNTD